MIIKTVNNIFSIIIAACIIVSGGMAITHHHCNSANSDDFSFFQISTESNYDCCNPSEKQHHKRSCCSKIEVETCCKIEFKYFDSDIDYTLNFVKSEIPDLHSFSLPFSTENILSNQTNIEKKLIGIPIIKPPDILSNSCVLLI